MSSIGSLTTSTSTSIRGYGGLASGLDRDELIEGMTIGTTTKINKQEQKKQQIEWMQEAIQTISDKMISFHSKYTETLTSPTNLFSSILWGRNKITTSGANSSKVSVSGTASSADAITIMGVKQKAENAKWTSTGRVSEGKAIESGSIDITNGGNGYVKENLEGKTIKFNYGGSDYTITLSASDGYDYTTADGIASAINDIMSKQTTSDDKKLSSIVKASASADGKSITFEDIGSGSNSVSVSGGSALYMLGLSNDEEGKDIKNSGGISSSVPLTGEIKQDAITTDQDFYEYIGGKSLTFSYNGTSGTVVLPGADELRVRAANIWNDGDAANENEAAVKAIAESIQEQLNKTFGKGRIEVSGEGGKLSFKTTLPEGGDDPSSILSITGGSTALVGANKGALELYTGQTTRTELNSKVDAGTLADLQKTQKVIDGETKKGFMLNGEFIEVKDDATIKDIMNSINNSKANVTVTYQEASDKFTFTSDDNGASGVVDFIGNDADTLGALSKTFGLDFSEKDADGNTKYDVVDSATGSTSILSKVDNEDGTATYKDASGNTVYEQDASGKITDASGNDVTSSLTMKERIGTDSEALSVRGQDAIVSVRYAGSDEVVDIRRDANTFTIDGLTIGVKGTFGEYDKNGKLIVNEDDAVEITASVDTDKLIDTIKSFVDEYNAIVDMVNTELTTKHETDYTPLSSEQKSELSEDEIAKWETKAKAGLLYGDSDLRSLSMDLRTVATSYVWKLQEIGISVSSTYSDNGKLSVDESKLRAALETDPESVEKLFTSTAGVDENGNPVYNGIATNLKSVMEKYVKTTGAMQDKGILIRKAGSSSSAMSMTQNTYYSQIAEIDKLIATLNERLQTERDRYIKQFTSLETLISNMNSQASYLSSMSGY